MSILVLGKELHNSKQIAKQKKTIRQKKMIHEEREREKITVTFTYATVCARYARMCV